MIGATATEPFDHQMLGDLANVGVLRSAAAISSAELKRVRGSFSKVRSTIASATCESSGRILRGEGGAARNAAMPPLRGILREMAARL